ncbi:MAG: acyl carrier protein [Syntrophomonadaceae bacterium]|nr:acyl carrier protein [Syntrophomonadaceae bacterium]
MEGLFDQARRIMAEQLGIDPEIITLDSTFEDIDADSIDIVEMLMAIEDLYDVEFPEENLVEYKTMGALIKALYQVISDKQ